MTNIIFFQLIFLQVLGQHSDPYFLSFIGHNVHKTTSFNQQPHPWRTLSLTIHNVPMFFSNSHIPYLEPPTRKTHQNLSSYSSSSFPRFSSQVQIPYHPVSSSSFSQLEHLLAGMSAVELVASLASSLVRDLDLAQPVPNIQLFDQWVHPHNIRQWNKTLGRHFHMLHNNY